MCVELYEGAPRLCMQLHAPCDISKVNAVTWRIEGLLKHLSQRMQVVEGLYITQGTYSGHKRQVQGCEFCANL